MTKGDPTDQELEHLQRWIGNQETVEDTLTPSLARAYAATFGFTDQSTEIGAKAPRLIHWCLGQAAVPEPELGPDGHPARGGFLPPVKLERRMWAGGRLTFSGDLLVGDTVRRVSKIDSITFKSGRTGPLCFVTVSHTISVGGVTRIREVQDLVYRGAAGKTVATASDPAPAGMHNTKVVPSTRLLFRYSALTFNAHRIHYDRPYATDVEGYEGLVVHGPLQAALLYYFAQSIEGVAPSQLSFRGRAPLVDTQHFYLNADPAKAGRMELWTAPSTGPSAMTALAEWV